MCRRNMRSLILCLLMIFIHQSVLLADEDEGYFLNLKQKGQLISLGCIQDDQGIWYNVWICPGYVPPYRYAKKYFYKTGADFDEYLHANKYQNLARRSKDAYRWAFEDCIHTFIIKGIPKTWNKNFQVAGLRTDKHVFGWWFAYPWAFMESTVESVVRIPLGLAGSAIGTGCATAVIPAYYMTNSTLKGAWHLSVHTIIIPVTAETWNALISPPLALVGQKPALDRVDGFWVKTLTNEQVSHMEFSDAPVSRDDIIILEQWGMILDSELKPYEIEYDQVRNAAETQIKKIRDDQKQREMEISAKESQHVANLKTDPSQEQIIAILSERGFTADRVKASRSDLREALQANGAVDEKRINHIIELLIKYPPSLATEKGFRGKKTDPLQRSVDIIKNIEPPQEESKQKQ